MPQSRANLPTKDQSVPQSRANLPTKDQLLLQEDRRLCRSASWELALHTALPPRLGQTPPSPQERCANLIGSLDEDLLLIVVAAFKQSPATMHRIESTSRSLAKAVGTMATNNQLVFVPRHFTAPQDAVDYAARGGGTVVLSTGQYEGKLSLPRPFGLALSCGLKL